MMKLGYSMPLRSTLVAAVALLCSLSVLAEETSNQQGGAKAKQLVCISDPLLQADMQQVLKTLRKAAEGKSTEWDALEARFETRALNLHPLEVKKALTAVHYYMSSGDRRPIVDPEALLMALGETNAIKRAVQSMLTGRGSQRKMARQSIMRSRQAEVISALVEPLFRDETVLPQRHGEDTFLVRGSVDATYVIIDLLGQSDQIPTSVANWAQQLNRASDVERRSRLREWWALNADAMKEKRFCDTVPLPKVESPVKRVEE